MKQKKEIMGLAALLILVFHFWIPLTGSVIESTIYRSGYIGVDIFFFLSACTFGRKKEVNFGEFIKNRFIKVYCPFLAIALICAIYKHWKLKKLIMVLSGIEFIMKGGGAFLWYVIAVMLFYLCVPFLVKQKQKLGVKLLPVIMILWAVVVGVLQFVFHYTDIFIFLNRIPIIALGLFYEDFCLSVTQKARSCIGIAGLIVGGYLIYKFGANVRLSKPIADIYYVCAIPFVVSLVEICNLLFQKKCGIHMLLRFIGGITLELYGFQMVFGYDIESFVLRFLLGTDIPAAMKKVGALVSTMVVLIVIAWIFSKLKRFISNKMNVFRRREI